MPNQGSVYDLGERSPLLESLPLQESRLTGVGAGAERQAVIDLPTGSIRDAHRGFPHWAGTKAFPSSSDLSENHVPQPVCGSEAMLVADQKWQWPRSPEKSLRENEARGGNETMVLYRVALIGDALLGKTLSKARQTSIAQNATPPHTWEFAPCPTRRTHNSQMSPLLGNVHCLDLSGCLEWTINPGS